MLKEFLKWVQQLGVFVQTNYKSFLLIILVQILLINNKHSTRLPMSLYCLIAYLQENIWVNCYINPNTRPLLLSPIQDKQPASFFNFLGLQFGRFIRMLTIQHQPIQYIYQNNFKCFSFYSTYQKTKIITIDKEILKNLYYKVTEQINIFKTYKFYSIFFCFGFFDIYMVSFELKIKILCQASYIIQEIGSS